MSFYLESMASDTTALIPLLRDGGKGFRDWANEAERFGSIMSDDVLKGIEESRRASVRLDQAFMGMKLSVAQQLIPAMNEFAELLGEQNTQKLLRDFSNMLGTAASKAVEFAGKIGEAATAYRNWLADAGRLPADMLDNLDQIDARIKKLSAMRYGNDPLNTIRRGLFGESIDEELRKAIEERNRFQWRNVVGGSDTVDPNTRKGGRTTPTGGGARALTLPDFGKNAAAELREQVEAVADARREYEAWAAQLSGPMAEASYNFAIDQQKLIDLARAGEISTADLASAQANLRAAHEANVDAINRQLNPQLDVIDALEEEVKWLKASTAEQYRMNAARMAGKTATDAQVAAIEGLLRQRDQLQEAQRSWDDFGRSASDALFDVATGAKSAKDALGDFLDSIFQSAMRSITDNWGKQLADMFKGMSGGSSGAGGWASIIGSLFGGARATGGPVDPRKAYLVGEKGPELFMPGQRGYVNTAEQTRRLGAGVAQEAVGGAAVRPAIAHPQINQTILVQGKIDRRSAEQLAADSGREIQTALRRRY